MSVLRIVPAHLHAAQKAEARRIHEMEAVGWAFWWMSYSAFQAMGHGNHTEVSTWALAGERVLARAAEAA